MIDRDYYDAHDPDLYVVKNGVRTLRKDPENKKATVVKGDGSYEEWLGDTNRTHEHRSGYYELD